MTADATGTSTPPSPPSTPSTPNPAVILARPAVQAVLSAMRTAGSPIDTVVRVLPATAPTAAAAAAQLGCEVGAIANSLIFELDNAPLLVLTSGAHRVDTKALAGRLGVSAKKLKRAKPEFVKEFTGQTIGGVAPTGHKNKVRTLVDPELEQYPEVWAAAGHHHAVFPLDYATLVRVTEGEVVKVD